MVTLNYLNRWVHDQNKTISIISAVMYTYKTFIENDRFIQLYSFAEDIHNCTYGRFKNYQKSVVVRVWQPSRLGV